MVSANNKGGVQPSQKLGEIFREFENIDVVNELSKLREEIRHLREQLTPPKSALITGADVERILRSLK